MVWKSKVARLLHLHHGRSRVQVNLHALIRDEDRPEQAVGHVARVDGGELLTLRRSTRLLIEVKSEEREGPAMQTPVHPDVPPLHEAHVVVGIQGGGGPSGECARRRPLHMGGAEEPGEIGDGRQLVGRPDEKDVEHLGRLGGQEGERRRGWGALRRRSRLGGRPAQASASRGPN